MYLTHNESTSVVAERVMKTLKDKICKKLIPNENKSYLGYLNLKLMIDAGLLMRRIFLAKVTPRTGQEKYLLLVLC